MVDELWDKATAAGVDFLKKKNVTSIEHHNGIVQQVLCKDGTEVKARNVIITTPPKRTTIEMAERPFFCYCFFPEP